MGGRQAMRRLWTRAVAIGALGSAALAAGTTGLGQTTTGTAMAASTSAPYKVGNETDGILSEFTDPTGMPAGVTNGPCTPDSAHPYPVILVHGTFANENFSWQTLAPMLANAGYCVFGLNYGATAWTTYSGDHSYAVDYIEHSAAQLQAFATNVLAWTTEPDGSHPTQVDVVGHSQGGLMPRYWIDDLGGSPVVHTLVGLAPSNHGTTADGLVTLASLFGPSQYQQASAYGCGACGEQEAGSPFLKALPDTVPGPDYYVIESARDEVVTPYQSAFLSGPNVVDVTLQDQCPTDETEHIGIIYDPVAIADVMAALADNSSSVQALPQPACPVVVAPVLSG